MLNKVMIIGRLGRDPELRYTQNGTPVTSLSIATDESYVDRDGVRQERTEWHRVTVFQKQAENCSHYLFKGSLVFVEGSLQTRKWQDQQGQDRYTTEIKAQRVQFLERRPPAADGMQRGGEDAGYGAPAAPQGRWGAPQPAYQGYAPAPQPGYQAAAPAPQPGYQAAAPAPQPGYQAAAPAPAPQPDYQAAAPAPQPAYPGRPAAAPAPQSAYPSEASKEADLGTASPSESAVLDEVPF